MVSKSQDGYILPAQNRRPTDLLWLFLLVLTWAAMLVVAGFGLRAGDPSRILYGYDSNGYLCGTVNTLANGSVLDLRGLPKLYGWDLVGSKSTCVAECPASLGTTTAANAPCDYGTSRSDTSFVTAVASGACAGLVFATIDVLNRCVPLPTSSNSTIVWNGSTLDFGAIGTWIRLTLQQMGSDLAATWQTAAWFSLLAAALCLIWMIILRYAASALVWTSIILFMLGLDAFTIWLGIVWMGKKSISDAAGGADGRLKFEADGTLVALCVAAFLAVVYTFLVVFLRNRIRIACGIVREASRAMAAVPSLLLLPIGISGLMAAVVAYTVWIGLYLWTAQGRPASFSVNIDGSSRVVWESYEAMKYIPILHLFGALWTVSFVIGFYQTVIAGTIGRWYFSRRPGWTHGDGMPQTKSPRGSPLLASIATTLAYHLGTIAFGSLLIALTQLLRILVKRVAAYIEKIPVPGSKLLAMPLRFVSWLLGILVRLLKFLAAHAYIETALRGMPFCQAASRAGELIGASLLRTLAKEWVADFVLWSGKLLIAGSSAAAAYAVFVWRQGFGWAPVVLVGAIALAVSHMFLGCYRSAIDAVFLCVCEDLEISGEDGAALRMAESLRDLVATQRPREPPSLQTQAVVPMPADHNPNNYF